MVQSRYWPHRQLYFYLHIVVPLDIGQNDNANLELNRKTLDWF